MNNQYIDPTIAYDVVELPSMGIYYQNKKKSVKVAYLTASDENILAAPNLTQTNQIVTEILKRKVVDKDIDVEELVDEDRQAILIFLRNTAFGTEYKVTLTDPKTNQPFDVEVDLSSLSYTKFDLVADVNGEYSYTMPKSGADVTFVFVNQKQELELEQIQTSWNGNGVAPIITKRMEMMIKSAKGNRDPMAIRHFVESLPIKDSQDFRKFTQEKKPGLDLTKKTTTPSGEEVQFNIGFGVEFFRPFYGL